MKGIKNILTLRALSAKKLSNEYLLIYDATLTFFMILVLKKLWWYHKIANVLKLSGQGSSAVFWLCP